MKIEISKISIDECSSAANSYVRKKGRYVRRQESFSLTRTIITSEGDRDTHRSLFMSNIHFELRKEGEGLVKEEMNSYND